MKTISKNQHGNIETIVQDGDAGIIQVVSKIILSPEHNIRFGMYKVSLREPMNLSSKLLPVVISLWESRGNEQFTDFYSFDNNGICLSHGFSKYKGKKCISDEQHDTNIDRLKEHAKLIREILENAVVDSSLSSSGIYQALLFGYFEK